MSEKLNIINDVIMTDELNDEEKVNYIHAITAASEEEIKEMVEKAENSIESREEACPPHIWNYTKIPYKCNSCGVYYPG